MTTPAAAHKAGVQALRDLVDEVEDFCRVYTGRTDPILRQRLAVLDRLTKKIRKAERATTNGGLTK